MKEMSETLKSSRFLFFNNHKYKIMNKNNDIFTINFLKLVFAVLENFCREMESEI